MRLKGKAAEHNNFIKVIEWLVLIALFSIILMTAWAIIWKDNPLATSSLKWLQFFQSIGVFLLPALAAAYLWSDNPIEYLNLNRAPKSDSVLFAITIIIIALPAVNLLGYLNQQIVLPDFLHDLELTLKQKEDDAAVLTEKFLQTNTIGGLTINLILMALLPAICEESCFRGILLRLLCNDKPCECEITRSQHIAIWATAIIFSFVHFQFYGFIPRMLLGALLGYLLIWTGNLWVPIIAHFTNNAVAVIVYYIAYNYSTIDAETADTFGSGDTIWLGITSILATIVLIVIYIKKNQKKLVKDEKD